MIRKINVKKLVGGLLTVLLITVMVGCGETEGVTIIQNGSDVTGNGLFKGSEKTPDILYTDAHNVNLVNYQEPNGFFTVKCPAGWSVKTGLPMTDEISLVSYAIKIYNTSNPDICACIILNHSGMVKSQEAYNWYNTYYPSQFSSQCVVVDDDTTEAYYRGMSEGLNFSDFNVTNNLEKAATGGDVLDATCTSINTGKKLRGLFSAFVSSYDYAALVNPANIFSGMLDVGYRTAYSVVYMTAPEEEFLDWQPILEECISSIQFTESFHQLRQQEWKATLGTAAYISQNASDISNMVMDSWEQRNTSQDIISQKQSDATLSYERVYDTQSGEIYRAYNGFLDNYSGSRFEAATDDMYLKGIDGYIQK